MYSGDMPGEFILILPVASPGASAYDAYRAACDMDINGARIVSRLFNLFKLILRVEDDGEAIVAVGKAGDVNGLSRELIAVGIAPAYRHPLPQVPAGAVES